MKLIAEKQQAAAMRRQVIASDAILKDFNWEMNMPLDQSHVVKSGNAVLDHTAPREQTLLTRDVRAPRFEFTFELQTDEQSRKDSENVSSRNFASLKSDNISQVEKVSFSKVQLQQFFEELEKV